MIGEFLLTVIGVVGFGGFMYEKNKRLVAVIKEDILSGDPFKIHSQNDKETIYTYRKSRYSFTVTTTSESIHCVVLLVGSDFLETKDVKVLEFQYDVKFKKIVYQTISKDILRNNDTDIQAVEDFIKHIIQIKNIRKTNLSIADSHLPFETNKGDTLVKNEIPEIQIQKPINKVDVSTLTDELTDDLSLIVSSIVDNVNQIYPYIDQLDIEVKHVLQDNIIFDLHNLCNGYRQLNSTERKKYHNQMETSLLSINQLLQTILNHNNQSKKIDFEKTLQLVQSRYRKHN